MKEFREVQRFRQWWLWLLLVVALLPMPIAMASDLENELKSTWGIIAVGLSIFIPLLLLIAFAVMKLETRVDSGGVYYRLYPLQLNYARIGWDEVDSATVRQYDPIREYGGWGLRHSPKKGKAYNVAGNKGLQLLLKDGQKILIGTQRPEELATILKDISGHS